MFHGFLRPSRTNFVFHQMTRELWKFECLVCIRVIDIHVIRSLGNMLQHKCLESEDVLVAVLKDIKKNDVRRGRALRSGNFESWWELNRPFRNLTTTKDNSVELKQLLEEELRRNRPQVEHKRSQPEEAKTTVKLAGSVMRPSCGWSYVDLLKTLQMLGWCWFVGSETLFVSFEGRHGMDVISPPNSPTHPILTMSGGYLPARHLNYNDLTVLPHWNHG